MELINHSKIISRYEIWSSFLEINKFKIIDNKKYEEMKFKKNEHEKQIYKDIIRTKYPKHLNEEEKQLYLKSLTNILTAYTNDNPKIGYIQGMNIMASSILYNLIEKENNFESIEYKSYKIFYCMLDKYKIIKIYKNKMCKIFEICDKLKSKFKNELFDVYEKFINLGLDIFLLFGSFYYSILLEFIDLESTSKVIDIFLIYGFKIITLLIFLMVKIYKDKILKLEYNEDIIMFIRNELVKLFYQNYDKYKRNIISEIDLNLDFYEKNTNN